MSDNNLALVIDDSVAMRQQVTSILSKNDDVGLILEADNPDEALRLLMEHDGKLQFIVSDWSVPGMPLTDFIQIIQCQPRLAGAPLLLLMEEGKQDARILAKEVGATAVVTTPLDPEQLLVLTMALTGTTDRRRSKRISLPIACQMELGLPKAEKSYTTDVINISDTGILLRSPIPTRGTGYIYDIANLILLPLKGDLITVSARILRIEADPENRDLEQKILIALEFSNMDSRTRKSLLHYLQIHDSHPSN